MINNMEELQDAIEDAQYMNAVHDTGPKPSKDWKFLSPENLESYIQNTASMKPYAMKLEVICNRPLGFYLVRCARQWVICCLFSEYYILLFNVTRVLCGALLY